ncbi:MAG: hypothetical protein KJ576_20925 [Proteobacteria bacterium]|nr:hypothetical protein [Pseudomonadota bacterium]
MLVKNPHGREISVPDSWAHPKVWRSYAEAGFIILEGPAPVQPPVTPAPAPATPAPAQAKDDTFPGQCEFTKEDGSRCRVKAADDSPYCWRHKLVMDELAKAAEALKNAPPAPEAYPVTPAATPVPEADPVG